MTRFRTFAPTLGLAALAASALLVPAARAQDYAVTVTDLMPASGYDFTSCYAVSRGTQVGFGFRDDEDYNNDHALLWTGSAASVVDLNPDFLDYSSANGADGDTQVGGGRNYFVFANQAVLWHGTADSAVNLTPPNTGAAAVAVSGNTQVGNANKIIHANTYGPGHAYLWHGTAESAVDLHPAGLDYSYAEGVSGTVQVGYASGAATGHHNHAFLWHGNAASAIDLTPSGFDESEAKGAFGTAQVGYGTVTGGNTHALLWHGTAASVIDLNPPDYYASGSGGVSGDVQVGSGQKTSVSNPHALLWRGTAASVIDLNPFLPADYRDASYASSVDDHNGVVKVVGNGYPSGPDAQDYAHAFLWRIVFAPTLSSISPAARMAGTGAFTLTAAGMRFTHQSFIRWNGKRLPTMFQNSNLLRAAVPASLLAQAGTARITVSTPGVDASRGQTLTIR